MNDTTEINQPITLQVQADAIFVMDNGIPRLLRIDVKDCFPIAISPALRTTPGGDTVH